MPIQQMFLGMGGAGQQEVTETLTANSTSGGSWTAPAGVTSVNAVLTGADDIPQSNFGVTLAASGNYTSIGNAPSQASMNNAVQSWLNAHASTINAGAPGSRTLTGPFEVSVSLDNGDTVTMQESQVFYNSGQSGTVIGTMGTSFTNATHQANFGRIFHYFYGLQATAAGVAGNDATMFGFTAAGAPVGGSPTTVTQTNISVTPGQSYNFNSGYVSRSGGAPSTRNGSIVLTYYV